MTDDHSPSEIYDLWRLFRRAGHLTLNVRNKELARHGISTAESGVLVVVHDLDGQATPAEIGRRLLRKAHTISDVVAGLHRKDLVNKLNDEQRKNLVRVSLTDKGKAVYREIMHMESIRDMLSILSSEERQQFETCLDKVLKRAIDRLAEDAKESMLKSTRVDRFAARE